MPKNTPDIEEETPVAQPQDGDARPYLTFIQSTEYLREKRGVPIKPSAGRKMVARGEWPPPDAYFGRLMLYTPETLDRLAEKLITRKPRVLGNR